MKGIIFIYEKSICKLYFTRINFIFNVNKRRSVAAHEFGHALGLADQGLTVQRLMNGNTPQRFDNFGIFTPTSTEVTLVDNLY
ncbi:MAG: hypothetical protein LBD23_18050 [Oscillospiraceae bacterium]|jgi:hypothetical protein|nr:hypothetical protein [Oscillospiraceae bacterium]